MEKAKRYNQGKLKWSLVDFESLEDLVKVLEYGGGVYGEYNWQKGLFVKETCESLMRHLIAFMKGQDIDESGVSHLGHIQANAMFMSYMLKHKKEFDNRVKKFKK